MKRGGGVLVFVTSAAVLVLEILAGRMLAPYVGVRLETYTGVIGVILAGISAGSWFGGWLADRKGPEMILGPLIASGGIAALAVPFVIDLVGPLVSNGPLGIVTVAFSGFFAPSFLLSGVTPTVAKLQLHNIETTGRTVGGLSAIGTAGAIFGTFVSGFFLVAAVPTRRTVLALGIVLVVVGVVLTLRRRPTQTTAAIVLVALLTSAMSLSAQGPCEFESAYYCIQIRPDRENPSGRTLVLDELPHSYVDLRDPESLQFTYIQAIASVIDAHTPVPDPVRVLHVGGGGFTMPRYISATRRGSRNVVLELDKRVVEIDRSKLGLTLDEAIRVRIGDARMELADEPSGLYDIVIGDAFGSLSVPWHLTTVEFLSEIRRVLKPDGLYIANLIDYPPMRFVRAESRTLLTIFDNVIGIAPGNVLSTLAGGNYVVAASMRPFDEAEIQRQLDAQPVVQNVASTFTIRQLAVGAPLLRDDFAPVDQLLSLR